MGPRRRGGARRARSRRRARRLRRARPTRRYRGDRSRRGARSRPADITAATAARIATVRVARLPAPRSPVAIQLAAPERGHEVPEHREPGDRHAREVTTGRDDRVDERVTAQAAAVAAADPVHERRHHERGAAGDHEHVRRDAPAITGHGTDVATPVVAVASPVWVTAAGGAPCSPRTTTSTDRPGTLRSRAECSRFRHPRPTWRCRSERMRPAHESTLFFVVHVKLPPTRRRYRHRVRSRRTGRAARRQTAVLGEALLRAATGVRSVPSARPSRPRA